MSTTPHKQTNISRTPDETREIIERLRQSGIRTPNIRFEDLSVDDRNLYVIHVVVGSKRLFYLNLMLNIGPNSGDSDLDNSKASLIEKPYEESFSVWQHVTRITNRTQPFDDWRIGALFQVDDHYNDLDLDLVLSYMYFNLEWRKKLTIQLVDRYDISIDRGCCFFSIFSHGFKFIANDMVLSISHFHFQMVICQPFLKFQHLAVNRYDCCQILHVSSDSHCEIETLSLFDFPIPDVFTIILKIRNLKRLEIIGDLHETLNLRISRNDLYPKIARDFVRRQQVDFSMEIAEEIYQNKIYSNLFVEILRELNRINTDRVVQFLCGDLSFSRAAMITLPISSSFFNHRYFDKNLIGIISLMVGTRLVKK